jgi:hypothetical protein
MSQKEVDVEWVVQEVLRRLSGAAKGSAKPQADGVGSQPDSTTLLWPQRVVSWVDLADRLGGVRTIRVLPGAVVTPAARDELRRRGVSIEFRVDEDTAPVSSGATGLVLATVETTFDLSGLARTLQQRGIAVQRLAQSGLRSVIGETVDELVRGGKLGLLLTGTPAAAVCLANRSRGVRAALAEDVVDVHSLRREIGVNLLVARPPSRGVNLLERMAIEFCGDGAPPGPSWDRPDRS